MPAWILSLLEALAPTIIQAIIDALKEKQTMAFDVAGAEKLVKYEAAKAALK